MNLRCCIDSKIVQVNILTCLRKQYIVVANILSIIFYNLHNTEAFLQSLASDFISQLRNILYIIFYTHFISYSHECYLETVL